MGNKTIQNNQDARYIRYKDNKHNAEIVSHVGTLASFPNAQSKIENDKSQFYSTAGYFGIQCRNVWNDEQSSNQSIDDKMSSTNDTKKTDDTKPLTDNEKAELFKKRIKLKQHLNNTDIEK